MSEVTRRGRRLLILAAPTAALVGATAYAAVHPIPPDRFPHGCHVTDGVALQGDKANDTIEGTKERDFLRGGDGEDLVKGKHGSDCLQGQSGDDRVVGSNGSDKIKGGGGNDHLTGGKGPDRLAGNNGNDRIRDFHGYNRIFCGRGFDRVLTNKHAEVGRSCEKVTTRPTLPRHEYLASLTIKLDPAFHGRVNVASRACRRGRTVQLRQPGHTIGTTTTRRDGKWKLIRPGLHGRFYARVVSKRASRHPRFLCRSATSDGFVRVR